MAAPKVTVPLGHVVRPRCDGSRPSRNHQPFPCPLGFPSLAVANSLSVPERCPVGATAPRPRSSHPLPRACPHSRGVVLECHCPSRPGGFCALAPAWLGIGSLRGDAAPITRGLTAMGCSWLLPSSGRRDLTPLPAASRGGGISPQWRHGRARRHQPQQLCPAHLKPHHCPRPLPSRPGATTTRTLAHRSLPAGPGTPGALAQDWLRCWGGFGARAAGRCRAASAGQPGTTQHLEGIKY